MKINFVYYSPWMLGSGWMGLSGLRNALEREGLLNYAYDQTGKSLFDIKRLQERPIFYVRGFLDGRMPYVARAGNQFKAAWNSESWFTRHGQEDTSTDAVKRNKEHFNMMFTCSEVDLDKYDMPTYLLPSWCDTSVFKETHKPIFDKLGYIGGYKGREEFLEADKNGILQREQTREIQSDPLRMTREYVDLICKFKMLVSPPGRCFVGMCGRAFEIMGCRRMAFIYLNEETMFEHRKFFVDGVDCAYWSTFDELEDKFNYYKDKPDLIEKVATNGYRKIATQHNEAIRAKYIVDCMEVEYKKWKQDQARNPDEINDMHRILTR